MVTCALIGGTIFAQRDILMVSVMAIKIGNVVKIVIELVKLKRAKINNCHHKKCMAIGGKFLTLMRPLRGNERISADANSAKKVPFFK